MSPDEVRELPPEYRLADRLLSALALPASASVDQRVPKKMVGEQAGATGADKRLLMEGLEEVYWLATLKPGTVAIPAFRDERREYLEVVVIHARVRASHDKPVALRRLAELLHRAVPYPVNFDNEALIKHCIVALNDSPPILKTRLQWRKAEIAIGKAGVEVLEKAGAATTVLDEADIELPDLLTDLQDRTQLTRRTLVRILTECGRLDDFKRNPQLFIEQTANLINRCKRQALVDGIRYQKLGDEHVYVQELFQQEELTGYLKNLLKDTKKSIYEHVVYDSNTEKEFAEAMEKYQDVVLYAKLPSWFKVPTPLGSYNPDWAVLLDKDGAQRLYFVVETKSSLLEGDLRDKEAAKMECGKAHFEALSVGENPAKYVKATTFEKFIVGLY